MPGSETPEHMTGRPVTFSEWYALVRRPSIVKRGLKFAVVVGAILIAINHGDAIMRGELSATNYVKMGLTVIVPYVVSVFSSCGAIIEQARAGAARREPEAARRA